jgi:hypothetical protein
VLGGPVKSIGVDVVGGVEVLVVVGGLLVGGLSVEEEEEGFSVSELAELFCFSHSLSCSSRQRRSSSVSSYS